MMVFQTGQLGPLIRGFGPVIPSEDNYLANGFADRFVSDRQSQVGPQKTEGYR